MRITFLALIEVKVERRKIMAFLKPDKTYTLYGLEIKEKLITKDSGVKYYSNKKLNTAGNKPEYITIHNTADINEAAGTDDAEQYARATYNNNMGSVVVHYYIDETSCWHILPDDTIGWHAADGTNGPGNTKSVAIEIIMDGSGSKADTGAEDRGALLAAILLHKYGLTIDKMKTHQDWYPKKYCPAYILPHWDKFVAKVKTNLANIEKQDKSITTQQPTTTTPRELYRIRKTWADSKSQVGAYSDLNNAKTACDKAGEEYHVFNNKGEIIYTPTPTFKPYVIKVTANALNVRSGPGTSYKINTVIYKNEAYTIIEEKNGFGKLKSGVGWIALQYTVKTGG